MLNDTFIASPWCSQIPQPATPLLAEDTMASSLIKPARLGSIELAVPLGIGTMFWGDSFIDSRFNPILPAGDLRGVVDMALSARVTLFDTAEGYGGGSSEQRLAEALSGAAPSSSSPVIMTKFLPTIWRWTEYSFFSALRACQRRLGGRPIGVFFIHTPVHPRFEFWVRCACKARQQGLIQEVGLSNCSAEQVELAVRVASSLNQRIAANQVGPMHPSTRQLVTHLSDSVGALTLCKLWVSHSQSPDQPHHICFNTSDTTNREAISVASSCQVLFSLLSYNSESLRRMERVCQQHGITIIAYSVLGQGLLTDNLTREKFGRIRAAKMTGVTFEALTALRAEISQLASKYQVSWDGEAGIRQMPNQPLDPEKRLGAGCARIGHHGPDLPQLGDAEGRRAAGGHQEREAAGRRTRMPAHRALIRGGRDPRCSGAEQGHAGQVGGEARGVRGAAVRAHHGVQPHELDPALALHQGATGRASTTRRATKDEERRLRSRLKDLVGHFVCFFSLF